MRMAGDFHVSQKYLPLHISIGKQQGSPFFYQMVTTSGSLFHCKLTTSLNTLPMVVADRVR